MVFACTGNRLIGMLHLGNSYPQMGIVFVVGGPQYRVGSHRQFVLMARDLASAGIPVFRFDYRGMGDAEGGQRTFESVESDIRVAINVFMNEIPGLRKVVLLGLCDAASACLMYGPSDERVSGLILLNPWVRTARGEAKAYLRHYYLQRVLRKSFWRKVFGGKFILSKSLQQFIQSIRTAHGARPVVDKERVDSRDSFVTRMRISLENFQGSVLFLLSGRDLTAQEFADLCRHDRQWMQAVNRIGVSTARLPQADHTLSSKNETRKAISICVTWLRAGLT